MLIAQGINKKIGVCDIETCLELFDAGFYNPDTKEWREFQISAYKNELFEFVKHYTSGEYDYLVTFNGISFDQQVMEWIVENHQKWIDLSNLQITKLIANYAQKVIEDSNYGLFPGYKENNFTIPPIDLFRIHHLDNDAKFGRGGGMGSLKWCEYMMNMDVEEMPVKWDKEGLTEEEVKLTQSYRRHDVIATYKLLQLTIGETDVEELSDYRGKNKIEDRLNIIKETGMSCLNWSDVKIGEEWNKIDYMKSENVMDEKSLFPKKVKHSYGQKFKNFFPKTMDFKTEKLKKFVRDLGESYVLAEKQEFPITIGQTTYTIAKGGLHSTERNRKLLIHKGYKCSDADVGAQYPNSIIKHYVYPPHLKKTIIVNFVKTVELKDVYKQMGKDEIDPIRKSYLKGLEGGTKLRMNGGYYGKLGQRGSFLEYPEGLLKVCMGNQIEILMLIEMLEEAGFSVVSGNTDGIVTIYPEDKEQQYFDICKAWESKVGNDKMGKLEYATIKNMWQDSVNSYIAVTVDEKGNEKVKKKGRFVTTYGSPGCEINKNKSGRIIPLALEAYFIKGIEPQDFIRNHKNIFDFCIAKKATKGMHYEEVYNVPLDLSKLKGKVYAECTMTKVHKKLVRFYLSTEGSVLYKRGTNNKGKPMNNHVNAPNALGQPLVTYFNKFFQADDYKIDYNQYIFETLERIDNLENTRKAKAFADSLEPTKQLTLF